MTLFSIKKLRLLQCTEGAIQMPAQIIYLIEVLQHGFIVSCPAEGSSFELNAIYILLLRLLQLNASM